MAVFRVERNSGYTVMSNHHLRNKELTLKAKGLLSQMLSLPEDWDYTLAGLSHINRESIDAIRTAVWELEKAGYILRRQGRDEKGKMTAIEYTIYEQPQPMLENPIPGKPMLENPTTDNPTSENPTQLNKDRSRTNLPKKEKSITDLSNTDSFPILSPDPSPCRAAPERKGTEAFKQSAVDIYREIIMENIEYDTLTQNPKMDKERLDEIVDLMLTMRPLDERGTWTAKSKKEYDLGENGERIRLPSGRYKTHKIDLTGWNDKDNTLLWRKAWADFTNDFLERNGSPERIDHRSNAERGIDELPTVHMGVAACQMEKKGIATEKGELNRNIQKANRLIREIRAQIGKLKEWIADLFKAWETAPEQPPQSPNLANLLMKYLSVQREKSRKYSQRWQHQHAADELKTIAAAVNYLSEHGISNLDELDASLSSVSDRAYSIREGMKTAEERMKKLQKLIEYGKNYTEYKPIHDELKKLQNGWTNKRDKYEEAHRAELTLWNAASRYLHANLTDTKTLPISKWKQEYADLKEQRDTDYTKLKATRAEVAELQKIRKCVDIALKAEQPEQTQNRTKRHEQER